MKLHDVGQVRLERLLTDLSNHAQAHETRVFTLPFGCSNHLVDQLSQAGYGHRLTNLGDEALEGLRTMRGDVIRKEYVFLFHGEPVLEAILVLDFGHHDTKRGEKLRLHRLCILLEQLRVRLSHRAYDFKGRFSCAILKILVLHYLTADKD